MSEMLTLNMIILKKPACRSAGLRPLFLDVYAGTDGFPIIDSNFDGDALKMTTFKFVKFIPVSLRIAEVRLR